MKKLWEFLRTIYQSDKPESSKRFFGSIGFLSAIVFIALWQRGLINELMYVSVALIGFDTIMQKFKTK